MYFSEQGNVDDDATFITIFLVSFNLQSCSLMQSAVCSLQMSYTADALLHKVIPGIWCSYLMLGESQSMQASQLMLRLL